MARVAICPVPITPNIEPENGLNLVLFNAQSLTLHIEDIIVDDWLANAHVLCVCETRFNKIPDYKIPGFKDILRKDGECINNTPSYYGLAIKKKVFQLVYIQLF